MKWDDDPNYETVSGTGKRKQQTVQKTT